MSQAEIPEPEPSRRPKEPPFTPRAPMVAVLHETARGSDADHSRRVRELTRRLGPRCRIECLSRDADPASVAAAYARAHALVTRRLTADSPPLPRLRLLQVPASGVDLIDPAALPPNCPVCNVDGHETAMAEFALAAMLEWSIGLSAVARRFKRGRWAGSAAGTGPHGELRGRTLSIIGYGKVGIALAHRAKAFGMRVEALLRHGPMIRDGVDRCFGMEERSEFLRRADFLVLACPLNAATRGMVDASFLSQLPASAVLINLARAWVVEEAALFEALQQRRIAGAVLDVWWCYPTAQDPSPRPSRLPFHQLRNVLMTPHISSWSTGMMDRRWEGIARNLEHVLAGRSPEHVVPPGAITAAAH